MFLNVRNPYIELENLHNYKTNKEHCLLYNKSPRLFNKQGWQYLKDQTKIKQKILCLWNLMDRIIWFMHVKLILRIEV